MCSNERNSKQVVHLDASFFFRNACLNALNLAIAVRRKLDFHNNLKKVTARCTRIIFRGFKINSYNTCLRLPDNKLQHIQQELEQFVSWKYGSPEGTCENIYLSRYHNLICCSHNIRFHSHDIIISFP